MEGTAHPSPRPARKRITARLLRPETARPGDAGVVAGRRYYSPGLGRWTSRDPLEEEGGWNAHVFSANDPVLLSDLLGMLTRSDVFGRLGFINARYGGTIVYADSGLKDMISAKLWRATWAVRFFTSGSPGEFTPLFNRLRLPAFISPGHTEVHELTHAYLWHFAGARGTRMQEGIAYVGENYHMAVESLYKLERYLHEYAGDCTNTETAARLFWADSWATADYRGKLGYMQAYAPFFIPRLVPFPLAASDAAAAGSTMGWHLSCRRIAAMYNDIIRQTGCCVRFSCDPSDTRPDVITVRRGLPPELR